VGPENLRFGGGVSGTVLNPAVAVVLLLTGVLICVLPQRKVIVPFLLSAILIPSDQVLVVGGLHFPLLRILISFGMIRIFLIKGQGEWRVFSGGLNKLDKSLILLSVTTAVAGVLLFENTQALIYQFGELYTAFGTYFLLRCLIRDREDVVRVIRVLAFVVAVLGVVMTFEQLTGRNPYALLGGARAQYQAAEMLREGRVRAMGSFAQPILAGTFGAVVVPLLLGIWLTEKRHRFTAAIGIVGATTMVIMSNSTTPLFGLMAGLLGLSLWPIRSMMRPIRWGIVLALVSLHMVMKGPVWSLITHFDISGSAYHRYQLIDQTVRHFWQWWLIGTSNNANWGWDMWDTANQYVAHAVTGGLPSLIFFIAIIVYGFKYVGQARQAATDKKQALFFWALGAALFTYTMLFFGISLWDQSVVAWYALLAFIVAVAGPKKEQPAEQPFRAALRPGIAPADIQPAYAGASSRQLRKGKATGRNWEAPLHR
jgi:hypothetical protein